MPHSILVLMIQFMHLLLLCTMSNMFSWFSIPCHGQILFSVRSLSFIHSHTKTSIPVAKLHKISFFYFHSYLGFGHVLIKHLVHQVFGLRWFLQYRQSILVLNQDSTQSTTQNSLSAKVLILPFKHQMVGLWPSLILLMTSSTLS